MPDNSISNLLSSVKGIESGILTNSEAIKSNGIGRTVNTSVNKHGIVQYQIDRIDTKNILNLISESYSGLQQSSKIYDVVSRFDKYINPILENSSGEAKDNPNCITMQSEILLEKFTQISASNQASDYSKIDFVQSVKNFTKTINDFSSDTETEFRNSINTLRSDIESANLIIENIYQNNIKIRGAFSASSSVARLNYLDRRDELVSELSNYLNFKIKYDSHGAVRLSIDNKQIVGEDSHTKLKMQNDFGQYQELGEFIDSGTKFKISITSNDGGGYDEIKNIGGGSISGCLDLINNRIPQYRKMISEYAVNSAEVLNYANSFGISEKGNHRLTSSKKTSLDALMTNTNLTTISVVKDGKSIGNESAKVLAYDFDFEGKTVGQAVAEINKRLSTGTSQNSIDGVGNIRLVNNSKNGDILKFNLEFENFKDFKTKFQIADIEYATAAGGVFAHVDQQNLAMLNMTTEVESGKCVLGSQEIAVDFGGANLGSKIRLTVNAIGEDGTITPFQVEYNNIDMTAAGVTNDVYYLDNAKGKDVGGNYTVEKTFGGFNQGLMAKFVNEVGLEVNSGDGYIVIEGSGDNNVVMHDKFRDGSGDVSRKGLTSFFGMNNLINVERNVESGDNYSGGVNNVKLSIREDIAADPTKISTSSIAHSKSQISKEVGRPDAIKLVFFDNDPLGGNFAAADTVTLSIFGRSYIFTFAVDSNGMNVTVGVDFQESVRNLYEKLKNHADLGQLLDFEYDGALNLGVKSKVNGNKSETCPINISWNLGAGVGNARMGALNFYDGTVIKAVAQDDSTFLQNGENSSQNTTYLKSDFTIASIDNDVVQRIANIIKNKTFDFVNGNGVRKSFNFDVSSTQLFDGLNDISLEVKNNKEYFDAKLDDAENTWSEEIGIDLQKIRIDVDRLVNLKYAIISVAQRILSSENDITKLFAQMCEID